MATKRPIKHYFDATRGNLKEYLSKAVIGLDGAAGYLTKRYTEESYFLRIHDTRFHRNDHKSAKSPIKLCCSYIQTTLSFDVA